jgi:hypothetical protein
VRSEAHERDGVERLLRDRTRPVLALERFARDRPEHLVYRSGKPSPGGSVSLMPTPMQLLDRLAALGRRRRALAQLPQFKGVNLSKSIS